MAKFKLQSILQGTILVRLRAKLGNQMAKQAEGNVASNEASNIKQSHPKSIRIHNWKKAKYFISKMSYERKKKVGSSTGWAFWTFGHLKITYTALIKL